MTPTTYRSRGTIEEVPVLAGENLIWATHAGNVYSASRKNLNANFRFTTRGQITAGMGYWPPLVYAASADGYIYAIDERTGQRRWQYSTGFPAREAPPKPPGGCGSGPNQAGPSQYGGCTSGPDGGVPNPSDRGSWGEGGPYLDLWPPNPEIPALGGQLVSPPELVPGFASDHPCPPAALEG